MSKRSATEQSTPGQPFSKASTSGTKRDAVGLDEMGEFEDAYEDEIEEDEGIIDPEANQDSDGMDIDEEIVPAVEDSDEKPVAPNVFIPGTHVLGKDEILEADDSVYIMRHSMNVNWPCLSFDVLRDDLGDQRQRYPATAFLAAGTQADVPKNNELVVYKLSSLHKTQKDGDDSDDEDDNDDDEENLDEDAILEYRSIPHMGGVNRVRAQSLAPSTPLPPVSVPYHVATWADTGKVHIWDVRPLIESLNVPGYGFDKSRANTPLYTIDAHGRAEGFAMDWAPATSSSVSLLTGDIHSKIYLTTSSPAGFNARSQAFTSHTESVEDLQWSPSETTVFASCSADRTIRVWDIRLKGRKSVVGIENAHESDVNVISWNKAAGSNYLLLSGGDEGGIKVWDFRNVKPNQASAPVASFNWHKAPITSIEWHPTEDSIFVASGADEQVTMWDLAVEQDDDETGAMVDDSPGSGRDVPPQLLFVHQGQKDVKEVHWHPQIPGAVVSTASDGFNIFKTISV